MWEMVGIVCLVLLGLPVMMAFIIIVSICVWKVACWIADFVFENILHINPSI